MDKSIGDLFLILISAMLVTNFTLFYFLGLCPFTGVSARVGTALRMGAANIFVMTITSLVASFLNQFVLPHAPYLQTISFIVVIASLVQIVEMTIKKFSPTLFRELGIYLPLNTMTPVFIGGLIRHMVDSRSKARDDAEGKISDSGVLLSSGFIAGEGLLGVVIAILAVIMTREPRFLQITYPYGWMGQIVSAIAFSLLGWYLYKVALKSRQAGSREG